MSDHYNDFIEQLTAVPKLENIKVALFVQPHPDDNEIGAGGTMAYLKSMGVEVYALTVTDDHRVDGATTPTLRQKEALAAMEYLGVKNAGFLGFANKTDASAREIADEILKVVRELRPDALFSVDPDLENECHSDHLKVGLAVRYCFLDCGCEFYPYDDQIKAQKQAYGIKILGQYYTDKANTFVDISDYEELKYGAVACHTSQCSPELLHLLKTQSRYFANGTDCTAIERIKLVSLLQSHCFNI